MSGLEILFLALLFILLAPLAFVGGLFLCFVVVLNILKRYWKDEIEEMLKQINKALSEDK